MGTNLRQALSDIIEPSKEAETTMKKMGINFYTTSGKMKSLDSIVTTLRVSLSFLKTEEEKLGMLGEIFDIRGLTAINSFIKQAETGKGTIAGYAEAVKEIGYANKVAATQMEASTNQLKIFIENLKTDMVTGFGETINRVFGNILKQANELNKQRGEIERLKEIGLIEKKPKFTVSEKDIEGIKIGPITIPIKFRWNVAQLENEIISRQVPEGIGVSPDFIKNVESSLEKWSALKTEYEKQGRMEISVAYTDAEKNLRTELDNARKRIKAIDVFINFSSPEGIKELEQERLEIGKKLTASYKAQNDLITKATENELDMVSSASSILAIYDKLTGKLKYNASELKMTDDLYKSVTEKVKEIKKLSETITAGLEIGEDVTNLEELKNKLTLDFSKMTDFSVSVKAMLDTDFLKLQIETIGNIFENLKEESRIGMLTGAMKDLEKAKILVEEFTDKLETIKSAELGYTGMTDKITEMNEYINLMESNVIRTEALKTAEENFQNQIKRMREELKLANKTLTEHRDSLSSVNKEISRLSGQRFTGETEFLRLISEQNKYLDEQRLAELGIYDAQSFINNALVKTTDGYSGLVKSMEKVNQVAEESKNTYDSWKTTVEEFIKASITSGEGLGADVTGEVKKFQTMLLGVTDMPGSEKGTTEAEQNLEKLKLAYDYYYGGMREDVKFATMEHEDSVNGIASGSSVVISALQSQWSEQFKLNNLISESSSYVDSLNVMLEDEVISLKNVTDTITELTKKFDGMNGKIYESIHAFTQLNDNQNIDENYKNISTTPLSGMNSEEANKTGWSYSGAVGWYKPMAEGGVVNSPTRALIGEAGPEAVIPLDKISGFGNIEVNVNVTTDANPEEIAREVKRELMSL